MAHSNKQVNNRHDSSEPPATPQPSSTGCLGLQTPPEADESQRSSPSTRARGSRSRRGNAITRITIAESSRTQDLKRQRSNSLEVPEKALAATPPASTQPKRVRLTIPQSTNGKEKSTSSDDSDLEDDNGFDCCQSNAQQQAFPTPVSAQFPPESIPHHEPLPQPLEICYITSIIEYLAFKKKQVQPASKTYAIQIGGPPQKSKPFSLLDAFLKRPELILRLAGYLEVSSLTSLYAISKPFHFIVNSHYTTYIKESMERWAPDSAYIFPWRCYGSLTIKDPGFRPMPSDPALARDVPSLKWLQMVAYRHKIVRNIIDNLEFHGHLLRKGVEKTLKKIWFTMDLPNNGSRIAVLHNSGYWLDSDLFDATLFFIKLDMRLTNPVRGTGQLHLRKLLMGQRNLVPLHHVLVGKFGLQHIVQMSIWYDYNPYPQHRNMKIMDVPARLVGRGCLEGWGRGTHVLMRVDEGIMRESIRRNLGLHNLYFDYMLFGFDLLSKKIGPKRSLKRYKDRKGGEQDGETIEVASPISAGPSSAAPNS